MYKGVCLLKMRACLPRRQGFTLIELLIVVAMIGIIGGVILVSMSSGRNKANAASTKTTLNTLKSALAQCCSNVSNSINTVAAGPGGGLVCNAPSTSATYPTVTALKLNPGGTVAYAPIVNCSGTTPEVGVVIAGHPDTRCNGLWRLELFGKMITPGPGC